MTFIKLTSILMMALCACIVAGYNENSSSLTPDDIVEITWFHNYFRRKLAQGFAVSEVTGKPYPMAANMRRMEWDKNLAAKAQEFSQRCSPPSKPGHEPHTKDYQAWENVAYDLHGYLKLYGMIEGWYNEIVKPTSFGAGFLGDKSDVCRVFFGPVNVNGSVKMKNHGTAMLWHDQSRIGCGVTSCTNGITLCKKTKKPSPACTPTSMFVCLYSNDQGKGGNFHQEPMYTPGEPCSLCEKTEGKHDCENDAFGGLCTKAAEESKTCDPRNGKGYIPENHPAAESNIKEGDDDTKLDMKEDAYSEEDDIKLSGEAPPPSHGSVSSSPTYGLAEGVELTANEKYMMVDFVNLVRTIVATGNANAGNDTDGVKPDDKGKILWLPSAADMYYVKWSNFIQFKTATYLNDAKCSYDYTAEDKQLDPHDSRATLFSEFPTGKRSLKALQVVVQGWKRNGKVPRDQVCQLVTPTPAAQLMTSRARRVGCALKKCTKEKKTIIACTFGERLDKGGDTSQIPESDYIRHTERRLRRAEKKVDDQEMKVHDDEEDVMKPESGGNYLFAPALKGAPLYTVGPPAAYCRAHTSNRYWLCTSRLHWKDTHEHDYQTCKERTELSVLNRLEFDYQPKMTGKEAQELVGYEPGDKKSGWFRHLDDNKNGDDIADGAAQRHAWLATMISVVFAVHRAIL